LNASHELRSPLATIISALEVAAAHPELLDQELAGSTLMPEAQRMRSLVEDLLLLARADERGLSVRREDIDLDDLAAGETARLRRETHLAVHTDFEPTRVVGDTAALSRVLRNLLDNAARHAKSRVEFAVWSTAHTALVCVGDDGAGIPEMDRQKVFDRFVRLDSDRSRSGGGTGLGLAIVAEIVAAHHGSVRIDDRPGGGTRVTIQLPLEYSPDSNR
jgi:signal transduction histidine kinase